jgi:hypothetical protein
VKTQTPRKLTAAGFETIWFKNTSSLLFRIFWCLNTYFANLYDFYLKPKKRCRSVWPLITIDSILNDSVTRYDMTSGLIESRISSHHRVERLSNEPRMLRTSSTLTWESRDFFIVLRVSHSQSLHLARTHHSSFARTAFITRTRIKHRTLSHAVFFIFHLYNSFISFDAFMQCSTGFSTVWRLRVAE